MTTAKKLLSTQTGGDKLYVDDVFSTYLYTGNGSTQTINNGIDLAGKGGLVWIKQRNGSTESAIFDSSRSLQGYLSTNLASIATSISPSAVSLSNNGFSLPGGWAAFNNPGSNYTSWTFRKAPKFFDVVTWTGDGVGIRQIPHKLGVAPGMVIIKRTDSDSDWIVAHLDYSFPQQTDGTLRLNKTDAVVFDNSIQNISTSTTYFTLAPATYPNTVNNVVGATYVAYLFAHDTSPNGLIQCGSYTTDTSGNATVNLGWEPQFVTTKAASTTGNWATFDAMRGLTADLSMSQPYVSANSSGAEALSDGKQISANGFTFSGSASTTYIYLAIRSGPMRVPTDGSKVFKPFANFGATLSAGFPADLYIGTRRDIASSRSVVQRLTSNALQSLNAVSAETDNAGTFKFDNNFGVYQTFNSGNTSDLVFRRAPSFFDIVCDTGTGSAHAINHSLTVAPELIIRKSRSANTQWEWWHSALAATEKLVLNTTAGKATDATAFGTLPTATQFYVGASSNTNASAATYVTYLFATCPGVSKVGYYTGNGTSLTVECGFSTGARFILAKSIDDAGDAFVWDTSRGIVAANDPHLSLNTTAAEVTTDDSVDPYAGGFIVNQNTATNINVNGKRYVFLAIA